jgi:hypothetical protein
LGLWTLASRRVADARWIAQLTLEQEVLQMSARIAINGFGRTGRAFYKAVVGRGLDVEVVAINDLASAQVLAQLLARDSVHGKSASRSSRPVALCSWGR